MSDTQCPGDEALTAYVEGKEDPILERHMTSCAGCAEIVRILRELRDLDAIDEVAAYLDDLQPLISEIESTPAHRHCFLLQERRFHRADLVMRLLARGLHERWRNPQPAIDLTGAAATLTGLLETDDELVELRFQSWNLHSAFLRESGRYQRCRNALARAEEAAEQVRDVEMAQASVLLGKALLASEPDVWQPEEAEALLDVVEAIYRRRRNDERWLRARTARGTLLYRQGNPGCVAVYEEVLEHTPTRDRSAYFDALAHVVIGRVEHGVATHDVDEWLDAIEAEHTKRHAAAWIARDRWLRGKVLAQRGDHQSAVVAFERASDLYRALNDLDAVVRVGIDTVASLAVLDLYDAATELCRTLADVSHSLDRAEPSRRRALTAEVTAYLRELAQRSILTPDIVGDLGRYVDKIRRQRPVAFVPPMPLYPV